MTEHRIGDVVLCHGTGIISWFIRFGQRIRRPMTASHWNHSGMLVWRDATTDRWIVLSAGPRGVECDWLDDMGEHIVLDSGLDARGRMLAVGFCKRALGRKYGWLTIASIIFNLLTPNLWDFHRPGTFICSGLVARAMGQGGYAFDIRTDMDQVMPADLAVLLGGDK